MKKIIINVNYWQTRVAIIRDEELQNIYFSSPVSKALEQSFFKGTVTTVLPGIQTAFVDIGQEKSGFLHISEIDRELALQRMGENIELEEIHTSSGHKQESQQGPDISKIFMKVNLFWCRLAKNRYTKKGQSLLPALRYPGDL